MFLGECDYGLLLANQVRAVEKSREIWRTKAEQSQKSVIELKKQLKKVATEQPAPVDAPNLSLAKLPDHEYSIAAIFKAVKLFLVGVVSFHACSRVIGLFQENLPEFHRVPTNNTVQPWVLRIGLSEHAELPRIDAAAPIPPSSGKLLVLKDYSHASSPWSRNQGRKGRGS